MYVSLNSLNSIHKPSTHLQRKGFTREIQNKKNKSLKKKHRKRAVNTEKRKTNSLSQLINEID